MDSAVDSVLRLNWQAACMGQVDEYASMCRKVCRRVMNTRGSGSRIRGGSSKLAVRPMQLALTLIMACTAWAQGTPSVEKSEQEKTPAQREKEPEGTSAFEADFVASDVFRSGSYVQPIWRGLGFEGHYFGGEAADVGFTGGSYTIGIGGLKVALGAAVAFGSNEFTTMPAFSFRWDYEKGWFVTQGLAVQGFRQTPMFQEEESEHHETPSEPAPSVRPTITDGNHLSVRWKRLTIGGAWEHIHFREGDEWKGGGRLALRLLPRVSAVLYVLGPGQAEWRGGVVIHPRPR